MEPTMTTSKLCESTNCAADTTNIPHATWNHSRVAYCGAMSEVWVLVARLSNRLLTMRTAAVAARLMTTADAAVMCRLKTNAARMPLVSMSEARMRRSGPSD